MRTGTRAERLSIRMTQARFDPKRLVEAATVPMDAVVHELVELLGGHRVVALLGAVTSTGEVQDWERREGLPEPERQVALRFALQAARLIADTQGVASAEAWFIGTNPHFGLHSPAQVLRDGGRKAGLSVLRAAWDFVAEEIDAQIGRNQFKEEDDPERIAALRSLSDELQEKQPSDPKAIAECLRGLLE